MTYPCFSVSQVSGIERLHKFRSVVRRRAALSERLRRRRVQLRVPVRRAGAVRGHRRRRSARPLPTHSDDGLFQMQAAPEAEKL